MESFEIRIGQEQKKLLIDQISTTADGRRYKIKADPDASFNPTEQSDLEDIPVGSELGQITVRSEKDFDFEGNGAFSGDELLGIAAQICLHPSFKGNEITGA